MIKSIRTSFMRKYLMNRSVFIFFICSLSSIGLEAHEIRPALLNIMEREPGYFDITWKVPAIGDMVLGIRPMLPKNMVAVGQSTTNKLPGTVIEYAIYKLEGDGIAGERIFIDGLSTVQIDVMVQIQLLDGTFYSALLQPHTPEYIIPDTGTKATISWAYSRMGIEHILGGIDHLLFVLALLLLVPDRWKLFKTITAFTVAHSITLGLSALGLVNVPSAPTEAIIALSIVFLAVEIVESYRGKSSFTEKNPWIVAMIFGLFHGLGFAGALSEIGLPQNEIPLALFAFNIGVEIGQIFFVIVVLFLMFFLKKIKSKLPDWLIYIPPYAIGVISCFWVIQRTLSFLS